MDGSIYEEQFSLFIEKNRSLLIFPFNFGCALVRLIDFYYSPKRHRLCQIDIALSL